MRLGDQASGSDLTGVQFSPEDMAADELFFVEWIEQGSGFTASPGGSGIDLNGGTAVSVPVIGTNDGNGLIVLAAQGTLKCGATNGAIGKLEYQLDASGTWFEAGRIFFNVANSHQSLTALRPFAVAAGAHTLQLRLNASAQSIAFDANCFLGIQIFEM